MAEKPRLFRIGQPNERPFTYGDLAILLGLAVLLYLGVRLAHDVPQVIQGPKIILTPASLPLYASLSVGRMLAAYILSILFSLVYGRAAAYSSRAEKVLMPLLDVLQSVPILSFLPVVLLSLSALLPQSIAAELASIILIFTSQAWNLTFAWYQSLTTLPKELREASTIFRFNNWMRFKVLELPFAAVSLIWNSVMSWAGGWFFLMAAEIFTVGERDFRLPGLGAYLQAAANQGDIQALLWGIAVLILVVVLLDQLVWRPLLAWSERFKLTLVSDDTEVFSWFYELLRTSRILDRLQLSVIQPFLERVDGWMLRKFPVATQTFNKNSRPSMGSFLITIIVAAVLAYGAYRVAGMLIGLGMPDWFQILLGLGATLLRVVAALVVALLWTIPIGVAIGTNQRLANFLQPLVQIIASVPATALFPAFLLLLLNLPGGLNLAAILLMLMGTQWYLLFNIIAGASSIPQDLKYTTTMLQIKGWARGRTLILPALFPYVITGAITASGGAWNASIVAEHVAFAGRSYNVTGIGSVIAQATSVGNYSLLLAGTLSMVLAVVFLNRLVWRRLYRLAEEQFRME
jgi:NitT/TauT family transport system permease protein